MLSYGMIGSVQVKDLLHVRPPLILGAIVQWLLTWFAHSPPSLSGFIGRHLRHVRIEVIPRVLQIAEQIGLAVIEPAKVDRVVLYVALPDHIQHFRPDFGVQFSVLLDFCVSETDYPTVAFHCIPFMSLCFTAAGPALKAAKGYSLMLICLLMN